MVWRLVSAPMISLVMAMAAGSSVAQVSRDANRKLLTRYGGGAAAAHLERRCKFLSAAERTEFAWHLRQVTLALKRKGFSTFQILMTQKRGREIAQQPKYGGCRLSLKRLVLGVLSDLRRLSMELTGQRFNIEKTQERRLAHIRKIELGIILAGQCGYAADSSHWESFEDAQAKYGLIWSSIAKRYGTVAIGWATRQAFYDSLRYECDGKGWLQYQHGIASFEALYLQFGTKRR